MNNPSLKQFLEVEQKLLTMQSYAMIYSKWKSLQALQTSQALQGYCLFYYGRMG